MLLVGDLPGTDFFAADACPELQHVVAIDFHRAGHFEIVNLDSARLDGQGIGGASRAAAAQGDSGRHHTWCRQTPDVVASAEFGSECAVSAALSSARSSSNTWIAPLMGRRVALPALALNMPDSAKYPQIASSAIVNDNRCGDVRRGQKFKLVLVISSPRQSGGVPCIGPLCPEGRVG
jgi:hypothetical protein